MSMARWQWALCGGAAAELELVQQGRVRADSDRDACAEGAAATAATPRPPLSYVLSVLLRTAPLRRSIFV